MIFLGAPFSQRKKTTSLPFFAFREAVNLPKGLWQPLFKLQLKCPELLGLGQGDTALHLGHFEWGPLLNCLVSNLAKAPNLQDPKCVPPWSLDVRCVEAPLPARCFDTKWSPAAYPTSEVADFLSSSSPENPKNGLPVILVDIRSDIVKFDYVLVILFVWWSSFSISTTNSSKLIHQPRIMLEMARLTHKQKMVVPNRQNGLNVILQVSLWFFMYNIANIYIPLWHTYLTYTYDHIWINVLDVYIKL